MPTTFPPTLERKQWKGSFAVERTARNPVNHTRRPRELSAETAAEVRAAAGPHSSLLFEAANLRAPPKSKASSSTMASHSSNSFLRVTPHDVDSHGVPENAHTPYDAGSDDNTRRSIYILHTSAHHRKAAPAATPRPHRRGK